MQLHYFLKNFYGRPALLPEQDSYWLLCIKYKGFLTRKTLVVKNYALKELYQHHLSTRF